MNFESEMNPNLKHRQFSLNGRICSAGEVYGRSEADRLLREPYGLDQIAVTNDPVGDFFIARDMRESSGRVTTVS